MSASNSYRKYTKPLVAAAAAGLGLYITKKVLTAIANSTGFQADETSIPNNRASAANDGPIIYTWPQKPRFVQKRPQPDDALAVPVLVMYGTEYGFSKDCAERLTVMLRKVEGVSPRCVNMEDHHMVDFTKEKIVLVCVSTQGDGIPPLASKPFYDHLHTKCSPQEDFWKGIRYSVLAIGDSNYPHFCRTGRQFDARFEELGAQRLFKRVDVDRENEDTVAGWMDGVISAIRQLVSANEIQPIMIRDDYLWAKMDEDSVGRSDGASFNKLNPYYATIKERRDLTTQSGADDKETYHIEFALDPEAGITYTPGDSIGVLPQNDPAAVNEILKALKCTGDELIPRPDHAYAVDGDRSDLVSLRYALTNLYDIKQIRVELLRGMRVLIRDPAERARLYKLFSKGNSTAENEDLAKYIEEREIVDILQEFPSACITVQGLITQLKPLLPRYYSISSTQLKDKNVVSATIAAVRYETLGRKRIGVCSTYLKDRVSVGDKIPVFINKNPYFRLPKDPSAPIIMIGPGTGIAPFRAFIHERALTKAPGITRLYFGCRRRDQDYLYKDELESFEKEGVIQLRTAFSREQKQKVYVQDLLKQDHEEVWKIISSGGHIYVCGDAKYMAVDVHKALVGIVMQHNNVDQDEAEKYLQEMEKQGRYEKDVWV